MARRPGSSLSERKELVLLGVLSGLLIVLAFTFGIQVGRRAPQKKSQTESTVVHFEPFQPKPESSGVQESSGVTPVEEKPVVSAKRVDLALKLRTPRGPFYLQVLAAPVTDSGILEKNLADFESRGLQPWVRQVDLPGRGSWYRVYLGGFLTRPEAESQGQSLKQMGKIKNFLIVQGSENSVESDGSPLESD